MPRQKLGDTSDRCRNCLVLYFNKWSLVRNVCIILRDTVIREGSSGWITVIRGHCSIKHTISISRKQCWGVSMIQVSWYVSWYKNSIKYQVSWYNLEVSYPTLVVNVTMLPISRIDHNIISQDNYPPPRTIRYNILASITWTEKLSDVVGLNLAHMTHSQNWNIYKGEYKNKQTQLPSKSGPSPRFVKAVQMEPERWYWLF